MGRQSRHLRVSRSTAAIGEAPYTTTTATLICFFLFFKGKREFLPFKKMNRGEELD